jgi:hypothetical protein
MQPTACPEIVEGAQAVGSAAIAGSSPEGAKEMVAYCWRGPWLRHTIAQRSHATTHFILLGQGREGAARKLSGESVFYYSLALA